MITKYSIGRKIVSIDQERTKDIGGSSVWGVDRIYLDNGLVLILHVAELDGDYAVQVSTYDPKKGEFK